MEATVDSVGRIVLPKALRDRLGFTPGTVVDVTQNWSSDAMSRRTAAVGGQK